MVLDPPWKAVLHTLQTQTCQALTRRVQWGGWVGWAWHRGLGGGQVLLLCPSSHPGLCPLAQMPAREFEKVAHRGQELSRVHTLTLPSDQMQGRGLRWMRGRR